MKTILIIIGSLVINGLILYFGSNGDGEFMGDGE